jgi:hypothetical protein
MRGRWNRANAKVWRAFDFLTAGVLALETAWVFWLSVYYVSWLMAGEPSIFVVTPAVPKTPIYKDVALLAAATVVMIAFLIAAFAVIRGPISSIQVRRLFTAGLLLTILANAAGLIILAHAQITFGADASDLAPWVAAVGIVSYVCGKSLLRQLDPIR